jgi:hypothetical protein
VVCHRERLIHVELRVSLMPPKVGAETDETLSDKRWKVTCVLVENMGLSAEDA